MQQRQRAPDGPQGAAGDVRAGTRVRGVPQHGPARAPPKGHPGVSSSQIRVARARDQRLRLARVRTHGEGRQGSRGAPVQAHQGSKNAPRQSREPNRTTLDLSGGTRGDARAVQGAAVQRLADARPKAGGRWQQAQAYVIREVQLAEPGARGGGPVEEEHEGWQNRGWTFKVLRRVGHGGQRARVQEQLQQVPRAVPGPEPAILDRAPGVAHAVRAW